MRQLKATVKNLEEELKNQGFPRKDSDIIITKIEEQETYEPNGDKITKKVEHKVNLTKKIHEEVKVLNQDLARQKIEQLGEIFKVN